MLTNSSVALDVSSALLVSVPNHKGFICCWPEVHRCALLAACFTGLTCLNTLSFRIAFSLSLVSLVNGHVGLLTRTNDAFCHFSTLYMAVLIH